MVQHPGILFLPGLCILFYETQPPTCHVVPARPHALQRFCIDLNLTLADLTSSHPDTAHVPCKFFRQGACQAGDACPFSHDLGAAAENVCKYFAKVRLLNPSLHIPHLHPIGFSLVPRPVLSYLTRQKTDKTPCRVTVNSVPNAQTSTSSPMADGSTMARTASQLHLSTLAAASTLWHTDNSRPTPPSRPPLCVPSPWPPTLRIPSRPPTRGMVRV